MPSDTLLQVTREALLLALTLSLPVVAVTAVIGLAVAALQAASQLQDATIAHLPRLLAATLALVVFGPWMGSQLAAWARRLFELAAR